MIVVGQVSVYVLIPAYKMCTINIQNVMFQICIRKYWQLEESIARKKRSRCTNKCEKLKGKVV